MEHYIPVDLPVFGEWVAINSPAERVPSHGTHYFGQTFAFDLARLNSRGSSFSTKSVLQQFLFFAPAESFLAWNQPVYAAFPGAVVAAGDGWLDRKRINTPRELLRGTFARGPSGPDYRPLLGNYCMVSGAIGVAVYAHLRSGSLAVKVGDSVGTKQLLGMIGNSGNTTMPHLHFHVMDSEDPETAKGVPVAFKNFYLVESGGLQYVPVGVPNAMERFVSGSELTNTDPLDSAMHRK